MRRYVISLFATAAVVLLGLASCSTDEEEVELTNHAFISNIKLGTVRRTVYVKDTLGNYVPSTSTFTAGGVLMSIDQRNREIQNRDSLLYGSDLRAVLMSVTFRGSYLAYRKWGDAKAEWKVYNSTDSVDLRDTLQLWVNSTDLSGSTHYKFWVNVHQQNGDSLVWRKQDVDTNLLTSLSQMRAAVVGGRVLLLGMTDAGVQQLFRTDAGEWQAHPTNLPLTTDVATLRACGNRAYVSTQEGALYALQADELDVAAASVTWTQKGSAVEGLQLAAVTDDRLYALVGNTLQRSSHEADVWTPEGLGGESADNLPQRIQAGVAYTQANGAKRLVLVGENLAANDTACVVWSKLWSDHSKCDATQWIYYTPSSDNRVPCPRLADLCVMPYDGKIMALGGAPLKGFADRVALDKVYMSDDHGLTWRQSYTITLPEELAGVSGPVTAIADNDNYIWVITHTGIWRGRLNRMGFVRQ